MRKLAPGLVALAAMIGFGLWALPRLPDQVVSHWGLTGETDGWSSKESIVFVLPLFTVGIAALMAVHPRRQRHDSHAAQLVHGHPDALDTQLIAGAGAAVIVPVVYSYFLWRAEREEVSSP